MGFNYDDGYSYHVCNNSDTLKKHEKQLIELELKIAELEKFYKTQKAYKEYKMMMIMGDEYVPERKTNKECEFIEIGDRLICNKCHKAFDNENFIPPYCPHCFAKKAV